MGIKTGDPEDKWGNHWKTGQIARFFLVDHA
jgi:hypothetical protein